MKHFNPSEPKHRRAFLVQKLRERGTLSKASSSLPLAIPDPSDSVVLADSRIKLEEVLSSEWNVGERSRSSEYFEILIIIAAVAVLGWRAKISFHVFGQIYLLVVIILSMRVSRWPVLVAAFLSSMTLNFVFMQPQFAFSLGVDDLIISGTYLVVALIGGNMTTNLRMRERSEHRREQQFKALFLFSRAISTSDSIDDAIASALGVANRIMGGQTALYLVVLTKELVLSPASFFTPTEAEHRAAQLAHHSGRSFGRFSEYPGGAEGMCVPLMGAGVCFGVLILRLPAELQDLTRSGHDLINGLAVQVANLIGREKLRASHEREKLLTETDKLRRTLLDSVSHELKTPLAVLQSTADRLEASNVSVDAEIVQDMRTATRRLNLLVSNLLDQSRIESGALKPQFDWCDGRDIIAAVRRENSEALKGHVLHVSIPEDIPLLYSDPVLMEQIINNLVINAAVHTPPSSNIWIRAGFDPDKKTLYFEVSDNGPGIDIQLKPNLFQKFSRAARSPAGGVGLGLSIVHGFTEALGGSVVATDRTGGGTTFIVSVPYVSHSVIPSDES